MAKKITAFILLAVVSMAGLYIFSRTFFPTSTLTNPFHSLTTRDSIPTPYPLYELTIPYLRSRTYESTLGNREVYEQYTNYTSYITSYDSDKLTIQGLLTIPTGEMPKNGWSAIVFVHGYIPPSQYETTVKYEDYVDYLAKNGFVVFKIDLRGHGTSEGVATGAYYSADYVIDTLNAIAALQKTDFVNPSKIGLWGHSMGGNVVMRAFAVKPTIPAVSIWAGAVYSYTDMQKYGISDSSYQRRPSVSPRQNTRQHVSDRYGSPGSDSAFWHDMAPTSFLSDLKGAIQINHAIDDTVVNIGYSRDLMALLDKTKVVHEFYEYTSGGHNIADSSFTPAMQNTVAFYKKYLAK
ncbi:MAG: alpha/beta fold hydrolase [Candidatus Roizmanbacteria bacterium]|nr:alpha/beta fold hydrolase [Candidatus Roizmanbacteria bacterium]